MGDNDNDINLAHLKERGKSSFKAKGSSGYDSDDSGRGAGPGGKKAQKSLSVQEQMVSVSCTFFACSALSYFNFVFLIIFLLLKQLELDNLMGNDDSPLAELEDYWSIQPRRTDMVMKWLNEPFLKEALERK